VDDNQIFIDEEVGHSLDVESHYHDGDEHRDVEEKENWQEQEGIYFFV